MYESALLGWNPGSTRLKQPCPPAGRTLTLEGAEKTLHTPKVFPATGQFDVYRP